MNKDEVISRIIDIKEEATNRYLSDTNFDVYDYLMPKEVKELSNLQLKIKEINKKQYIEILKRYA